MMSAGDTIETFHTTSVHFTTPVIPSLSATTTLTQLSITFMTLQLSDGISDGIRQFDIQIPSITS